MRRFPIFILTLAGLIVLAACTTFQGYHLMVNGFSSPETPLRLAESNSLYLLENGEAENRMFEREVLRKAERLLVEKGYRTDTYESADYFVVFAYGAGGEHFVDDVNIEPIFDIILFPEFHIGLRGFTFEPDRRLAYTYWLEVKVLDARPFRESGEDAVVWLGQVTCSSRNSDLRHVANYMLLGVSDVFGTDTGRALKMTLPEDEVRLRTLGD